MRNGKHSRTIGTATETDVAMPIRPGPRTVPRELVEELRRTGASAELIEAAERAVETNPEPSGTT